MRPSVFGRAFFHSRLYVKRCRVLTDWPCRPPMWPSLDKYAGEDMQVCRSKGFFNKRPVNENRALPADLHIFPCISVEVGRGVLKLGEACWTSRGLLCPHAPTRALTSPHRKPPLRPTGVLFGVDMRPWWGFNVGFVRFEGWGSCGRREAKCPKCTKVTHVAVESPYIPHRINLQ